MKKVKIFVDRPANNLLSIAALSDPNDSSYKDRLCNFAPVFLGSPRTIYREHAPRIVKDS